MIIILGYSENIRFIHRLLLTNTLSDATSDHQVAPTRLIRADDSLNTFKTQTTFTGIVSIGWKKSNIYYDSESHFSSV
eukprot:g19714.t1